MIGADVPPVQVRGEDNPTLADLVGEEPTLLIFFKEACDTCEIALPVFAQWRDQLRVIGVAQDDERTTQGFLDRIDTQFDVVYDEPAFAASDAFDIEGVPALFLVSDGVVTWSTTGWNVERATELADRIATVTGTAPRTEGFDALPPFRPG